MPELPEIETVRRDLEHALAGRRIVCARVWDRRLRGGVPRDFERQVEGRAVRSVGRRAKYLLIHTDGPTILSHLGMTGTWSIVAGHEPAEHEAAERAPAGKRRAALPPRVRRKHEHAGLALDDGRWLFYHDPRRFGLLDLVRGEDDPRLAALGPEPLDVAAFHADYLRAICKGRQAPIKAVLMDQRRVVGVGNIYAVEALFRARIAPKRRAGSLKQAELARLAESVREVLFEAIAAGGSSIDDYRQLDGSGGDFQNRHRVYGRDGRPCLVCGAVLKRAVLGGRATVWCPTCQR